MNSKLHKLRIAFSAACGIVCLLLVVLWVRSYWHFDACLLPGTRYARHIQSVNGRLLVFTVPPFITKVEYGTTLVKHVPANWVYEATLPSSNSVKNLGGRFRKVTVPYWAIFIALGAFAMSPWIRWRFSVRTLLVATTVVAILLGAIVYAVR